MFMCFFRSRTFPRGPGHPGKIPGTSRFLSSKPKEDKLSREGTNFSATNPWVGAGGRGAGRVFAGNFLGGGGAKYFFFGAEIPTK